MNNLSDILAKLLATLFLLACALGVTYLQMVHAWGLELKSIGWFVGTSLLSGVIVSVVSALNVNNK